VAVGDENFLTNDDLASERGMHHASPRAQYWAIVDGPISTGERHMGGNGQDQQAEHKGQEQATYLTLIGIFLGLFAAFSKREQDKHSQLKVSGLDLTMLGLTSYRTGRLAAYDQVTQPLRTPFTATESDSYGTSQTTVAEGSGVRKALGALIACPTCIGTWAAALPSMVCGSRPVQPGSFSPS
jgi:hypothetical protein